MNRISRPYDAFGEDLGAEAAAVDEALLDLVVGEAGEVVAGLVEAEAQQGHFSDAELLPYEMVQGDAAGDDVAAERRSTPARPDSRAR